MEATPSQEASSANSSSAPAALMDGRPGEEGEVKRPRTSKPKQPESDSSDGISDSTDPLSDSSDELSDSSYNYSGTSHSEADDPTYSPNSVSLRILEHMQGSARGFETENELKLVKAKPSLLEMRVQMHWH